MTLLRSTRRASGILRLTLVVGLLAAGGPVVAQDRDEPGTVEQQGKALVGVWESVGPAGIDCQTREPFGPIIRAVYTLHAGGTMSEENTDPVEGPYRTSGFGIWKPTSGRNYAAVYQHYGFNPVNFEPDGRRLAAIIKVRTNIRLSRDGESFTENGTFEVFFPDPVSGEPGESVFSGCFAATAHRLTF